MPVSIVSGLKRLIQARASDLSLLQLSWFGGEPLLALDIVLDVTTFARDACNNSGCPEFSANMTTYGYHLTTNNFLKTLNVGIYHYQITLDGDRDAHDAVRTTAGGKRTFDAVWTNLLNMRSVDRKFDIMIRTHYTPSSWLATGRLLAMIAHEFEGDSRFRVFLKEVSNLGGNNGHRYVTFNDEEKRSVLETLRDICGNRIQVKTDAQEDDGICYAARLNSFVIRADGRIGKCTVALDHEGNNVGTLCEDGTLKLSRDRLNPWLIGITTKASSHFSCPLSYVANNHQKWG
jgi:uncharacterized protein